MLYLVPRTHVAGLGTRFVLTAGIFLYFDLCETAERAHVEARVGVADDCMQILKT